MGEALEGVIIACYVFSITVHKALTSRCDMELLVTSVDCRPPTLSHNVQSVRSSKVSADMYSEFQRML